MGLGLWLACAGVRAGVAPPTADARPLDTVWVTGKVPGPGLWRVSDEDHELWILGTITPLPARFDWRATEVQSLIARAEAVLEPPETAVEVGTWRGLLLLPEWLRTKALHHGETLQTVLPAETYAHWRAVRDRYLPGSPGTDRLRPVVAAGEVYRRALSGAGLHAEDVVWQRVRDLARQRGVVVTPVAVTAGLDDPAGLLRRWAASPPQDEAACLEATLVRTERDLSLLSERVRLWGIGDIEHLSGLLGAPLDAACTDWADTVSGGALAIGRLRERSDEAWVNAATTMLAAHRLSVAVLPVHTLIEPSRVLDALRARGLRVVAPD